MNDRFNEESGNQVSRNIRSEQQWLRALFMVLFVVIYEVSKFLVVLIAVLQFIFAVTTGAANTNLLRFGNSLAQYIKQLVDYLCYRQDEKPFPFAEWPQPEPPVLQPDADDDLR